MVHLRINFQYFGLGNCSKLLKLCSLETDQVPAHATAVKQLLKARSISPQTLLVRNPEPLPPGFLELGENG
jgi:hypothetical protein